MESRKKSGAAKRKERAIANMLAAGSDKKQKKLEDLFKKTPEKGIYTENIDQMSSLECFSNSNKSQVIHSHKTFSDDSKENTNCETLSMPMDSNEEGDSSKNNSIQKSYYTADESGISSNNATQINCNSTEEYETKQEIVSDQLSLFSLFIPLGENAPLSAKVAFVKNHPIQPLVYGKFKTDMIYFRLLPDGSTIQRKWLSFCEQTETFYCAHCMAFSSAQLLPWVTGLKLDRKRILNQIKTHEYSKLHELASQAFFKATSSTNVQDLLSKTRSSDIHNNRMVLERVVDIILYLAKQDLAFRGDKHEASYDFNSEFNQGNFLEAVKLVAKYDPVLKLHVSKCEEKGRQRKEEMKKGRGSFVTFLSKTTYNKIIEIIGSLVKSKIAEEVNASGIFSLEVDSSQDISVKDQLCICLRYVFEGKVNERVVSLINVNTTTGEGLYKIIKSELDSLSIKSENLRGQSYDGAANMSGQYKGLQAFFRNDSPNSIFTHCHAHILNLVLCSSSMASLYSQNLFGLLQKTSVFFSESYKRAEVWKHYFNENEKGTEKLRKMPKIGATRWSSRMDALFSIFHLWTEEDNNRTRFLHMMESLHFIGYDFHSVDSDTAAEARNLLSRWSKFDIILTAFIYLHIFHYTNPVSKYLQTKGLDYIMAVRLISDLEKQLEEVSDGFQEIKAKAAKFISFMNTKLSSLENIELEDTFPERRRHKVKKMAGELTEDSVFSAEDKFRIDGHRRIVDIIINSLKTRYVQNKDLLKSIAFFDPKNFSKIKDKVLKFEEHDLKFICERANVNTLDVMEELVQFSRLYPTIEVKFCNTQDTDFEDETVQSSNTNCSCLSCIVKFLRDYNFSSCAFSNLYIIYKYIMTLPCTQVTCERAFSKMKIIKNRLRNSLTNNLLESLMIISIEKDLIPSNTTIIDEIGKSSSELAKLLIV